LLGQSQHSSQIPFQDDAQLVAMWPQGYLS
jgi:hypothetical protein